MTEHTHVIFVDIIKTVAIEYTTETEDPIEAYEEARDYPELYELFPPQREEALEWAWTVVDPRDEYTAENLMEEYKRIKERDEARHRRQTEYQRNASMSHE